VAVGLVAALALGYVIVFAQSLARHQNPAER
jgi:hypothetical protein